MKNSLIVIFLLLSCFINAQQYQPLLSESNEWHLTSCYNGCLKDVYVAHDDTTVGGLDYKILDGFHYISRTFLLREDLSAKKIYLLKLDPSKNEEFLLYDFSLNVGDSINLYNPISPFPSDGGIFILDSIISRPLVDGNNYRHFYLSPEANNVFSFQPAIWIESVGSLSLINSPGGDPDINGAGHVSCHFKGGDLHYANYDSISDCALIYDLGISDYGNSFASIYPTMVNDFVNVDLSLQHADYQLFSLDGQLISQGKLFNGNNQIPVNLPKGIYLMSIRSDNNLVTSSKLVKI